MGDQVGDDIGRAINRQRRAVQRMNEAVEKFTEVVEPMATELRIAEQREIVNEGVTGQMWEDFHEMLKAHQYDREPDPEALRRCEEKWDEALNLIAVYGETRHKLDASDDR